MPDESLAISQDELYARLRNSNSGSLLKKHLTPSVYEKLKDKVTTYGGSLADCIRSGNCFLILQKLVYMSRFTAGAKCRKLNSLNCTFKCRVSCCYGDNYLTVLLFCARSCSWC